MSDIVERLKDMQERIVLSSSDDIIIFETAAEILHLRAENEKLRAELAEYIAQAEKGHQTIIADACELRKEIHKLRAALKPFAESGEQVEEYIRLTGVSDGQCNDTKFTFAVLRAAAAALKETGDE